MRKILKTTWLTVCFVVIPIYFLSCFSFCIPPSQISFIPVLALVFPYLFVVALFCCITLFFIKRRIALATLAIIFFAGFKNISNTLAVNSGRWEMAKSDTTLRVMTWNVEHFIVTLPQSNPKAIKRIKILRAIQHYNPDVLCLQEFINIENAPKRISVKRELDSLGFIYSYLSNDSVNVRFRHNRVITVSSGVAIFSRIPLIDSARIHIISSGEEKNLIYADVALNGRRIRVFTTHLLSYSDKDSSSSEPDSSDLYQVPHTDKKISKYTISQTEAEHAKEVTVIRAAADNSPYPAVYCGDINATPASYTYNKLKATWQDAFLKKGFGFGTTYYGLLYTLRIDVCFADRRLKVQQCTVPQLRLSDHFPVVTDISWK